MTVHLFADGVEVNKTTLNATKSWKFTFDNLPVYKNGKKINYTISEDVVSGYTTVINNSTAGNFTITNTHVTNVTEINVTKVWNDSNNQDGIRPQNVTVHLFADGVEVNKTTLNATKSWKFTFKDLPVYKEGKKIKYTISEDVVSGYTTVISNATVGNFTITNTHKVNVTEVNVTKVWNDSNDQDGIRPKNVTVYLLADGNRVNETMLNDTNSWKFTFKDLPVYKDGKKINYTVVEVNVAGYTTVIRNSTVGNFTITNTHKVNVTEVNVTKVWKESGQLM